MTSNLSSNSKKKLRDNHPVSPFLICHKFAQPEMLTKCEELSVCAPKFSCWNSHSHEMVSGERDGRWWGHKGEFFMTGLVPRWVEIPDDFVPLSLQDTAAQTSRPWPPWLLISDFGCPGSRIYPAINICCPTFSAYGTFVTAAWAGKDTSQQPRLYRSTGRDSLLGVSHSAFKEANTWFFLRGSPEMPLWQRRKQSRRSRHLSFHFLSSPSSVCSGLMRCGFCWL